MFKKKTHQLPYTTILAILFVTDTNILITTSKIIDLEKTTSKMIDL